MILLLRHESAKAWSDGKMYPITKWLHLTQVESVPQSVEDAFHRLARGDRPVETPAAPAEA